MRVQSTSCACDNDAKDYADQRPEEESNGRDGIPCHGKMAADKCGLCCKVSDDAYRVEKRRRKAW